MAEPINTRKSPILVENTCVDAVPPTLGEQLGTMRLLAYLMIATLVIVLVYVAMSSSILNFSVYTRRTGFPGVILFPLGITVCVLTLTYAAYLCHPNMYVLVAFLVAMLSIVFWASNLAVRVEYYVKGGRARSNGELYLILAILSCLVIMTAALGVGTGAFVMSLVPLIYLVYLLYSWWFKI